MGKVTMDGENNKENKNKYLEDINRAKEFYKKALSFMEVDIETQITSMEYREGKDNSITIHVYDKSHDQYRTDLTVNYQIDGINGQFAPGTNKSFILDINGRGS